MNENQLVVRFARCCDGRPSRASSLEHRGISACADHPGARARRRDYVSTPSKAAMTLAGYRLVSGRDRPICRLGWPQQVCARGPSTTQPLASSSISPARSRRSAGIYRRACAANEPSATVYCRSFVGAPWGHERMLDNGPAAGESNLRDPPRPRPLSRKLREGRGPVRSTGG